MGAANALAGLSSGFVQSGGASQTAAADGAGGRSQLASAGRGRADPAHRRVPGAAVRGPAAGDAGGDRDRGGGRLLRLRRAAALRARAAQRDRVRRARARGRARCSACCRVSSSPRCCRSIYVVARLSRPSVAALGARPASGAWGRLDRHPDWLAPARRARGAQRRAADVPERERGQGPRARAAGRGVARAARGRARPRRSRPTSTSRPPTRSASSRTRCAREGIELRLADVRAPALEVLTRAGVAERVPIEPTLDAAVQA